MAKVKLTDAQVKAATLSDGKAEAVIWDTDVSGFGLRIRGASKSFVLAYRPAGAGRSANTKRLKIGTPGTLSVREARRLASAALGTPQPSSARRLGTMGESLGRSRHGPAAKGLVV